MTPQEKREQGICYDCNLPAEPNRRRCKKHLASSCKIVTKYLKTDKGIIARQKLKPWSATYARNRRRTTNRYNYVKDHAIRRNKEWELSEEDYYNIINQNCYYCEYPNNTEAGVGLDRLDNTKGYIIGNVVSCCIECNYVRGHRFTPEEMQIIGKAIKEVKQKRPTN